MQDTANLTGATERFTAALFAKAGPEFQLVAACCRWPPDKAQARISALITQPIQWPRFFRLAERHRVTGLVALALRGSSVVPPEAAAKLEQRSAQIKHENMAHIGVALRVARGLQTNDMRFLVLKGAPLAQLAFGATGVRHMRDIDLLVSAKDMAETERLLLQLGFQPEEGPKPASPRQAELWQRYRKHLGFIHPPTGMHLELHWRAFDNAHLGEVPLDNPQWVEVAPGQRLPTLPTQELLLLLCNHGASHAWFRLKWIADVAALMSRMPAGSWQELLKHANERDLDRPLEQARLLCAGLFEDTAAIHAGPSTRVGRWLAGVARDALLTEVAHSRSAETDFVPRRLTASRFLLRRDWAYRLQEARVNAASPADWKVLPMPDRLHFMYPLLRVPLWVRRRWFPARAK